MKILMTGGSGLLGSYLKKLYPNLIAPPRSEIDITSAASVNAAVKKYMPDVILHCAAFTSPPRVDKSPVEAMNVNIAGTCNLVTVAAAHGIRLVYISTDYVFRGDRGNYKEDDEVLPQNYYAWTKLGGECAVRSHVDSLIIRTTFSPDVFPYEKAFVDQYTSRDSLSVIAPIIYELTIRKDITGVINVGTERKTVKELAIRLGKSDVGDLRLAEVSFKAPADTSLDITRLKTVLSS